MPRTSDTTTPPAGPTWHTLDVDAVLARLDSTAHGLTADDAAVRLGQHGRNELVERGTKPAAKILWEQVTAFMVVLLIGAAILSAIIGKYLEAGAIGLIVVLFAILGFIQEYRAEQAIAALRRLAVPLVRVVRDGLTTEVPAGELVPGDIVLLEAGNVVPADLRLTESVNLRIEEAALTGESEPAEKDAATLTDEAAPLGDRRDLAFSGTQVTYGRAVGVVVATEIGRAHV